MWWLGDGGGREADFSAGPFANMRTASVEMTILWLKGKETGNGISKKKETTANGKGESKTMWLH
jgi:hypothetical protein